MKPKQDYLWVYLFTSAFGFAPTVATSALKTLADKAGIVCGGTNNPGNLSFAEVIGASVGIAFPFFRIVTSCRSEDLQFEKNLYGLEPSRPTRHSPICR